MKVKKILTITISTVFSILMLIVLYNTIYCFRVLHAADCIKEFKQSEYLKFMLYGNTWDNNANTISAHVTILDKNGNSVGSIERSWSGVYLSVEFNIIDIDDGTYVLPYSIYGKDKILEQKSLSKSGTLLEKYYLDNGECLLLGKDSSEKNRKYLNTIINFSKTNIPSVILGKKMIYTVDLSQCKTGIEYILYYTDRDGFIIREY